MPRKGWSKEDDFNLIKVLKNLGNKWVEISKMVPIQSESDIKNTRNARKRRCLNGVKKNNIP